MENLLLVMIFHRLKFFILYSVWKTAFDGKKSIAMFLFFCYRRPSSATTYNPNSFSSSAQRASQSTTTPRGITYVSGSARPFTSTTRLPSSSSSTTARPKSGKKNDYDYAYYDNAGGLEYDGVDLEHVTSNKESTKITRN